MMQDSSLGKRNAPKVLVFANRIKTVRFLQQSLVEAGFKAMQLHGDRSQPEREVSCAVFVISFSFDNLQSAVLYLSGNAAAR